MGRPRQSVDDNSGAGLLVGAVAGGLVGRSPLGAVLGAGAGTWLTSGREVPVPLELALRRLAEQHDVEMVSFHRVGARGAKLAIRRGDSYHWLSSSIDEQVDGREAIDDAIYDQLAGQLHALVDTVT